MIACVASGSAPAAPNPPPPVPPLACVNAEMLRTSRKSATFVNQLNMINPNPFGAASSLWTGSPLPFVVQASNPKLEVLSDQLVVNANGTFTENGQLRVSQGGTVVNQAVVGAGTYTLDGTAVSFQWSDGSTGTATVSGRTATVAEDGYSYVYKQQ